MCALGCLVADLRADFVATLWRDCGGADHGRAPGRLPARWTTKALQWLDASRSTWSGPISLRSADMCYVGQSFDVNVPLPERRSDARSAAEMIERFHERHTAIYGHADPAAPARLMTARVQIVGVTPKPVVGQIATDGLARAAADGRDVVDAPRVRRRMVEACARRGVVRQARAAQRRR